MKTIFCILCFTLPLIATSTNDTIQLVETVTLKKGTIVTLKLLEPIRSDEVEESTIIPAAIGLDVVVEGERVAVTGAYAEARVRRVDPASRFGKGALLEIEAINMQLIDGQRVKLAGDVSRAKGNHRRLLAWTVAIVTPAVGALFAQSAGNGEAAPFMIPFAGLGLLVKGKAAELPVGSLLTAVVTRDTEVQIVN
jgi:hypothetical protein